MPGFTPGPTNQANEIAEQIWSQSLLTPTSKNSVFNEGITADTDIFDQDLSPTYTPTTFRIYAALDTAGVLSITRTREGNTVTEQLNSGNNLNANAAYIFDIIVHNGETINLQFGANATALMIKVVEVPQVIS